MAAFAIQRARSSPRHCVPRVLAAALFFLATLNPRAAAEPTSSPANTVESSARTPEALGLSRDDPWASERIVAPAQDSAGEDQPLHRSRAATSAPARTGVAQNLPWSRSILSLLGVLGLIALLSWGYRSVAGGSFAVLPRRKRTAAIEVLSRAALSPRHSVCLIRVGDRAVLVGLAPQSVTTLDVVTEPAAVARLAGAALTEKSANVPGFDASLAAAAQTHMEAGHAVQDNAHTQARPTQSIDKIRDRLSGTLARLRTAGERA